ncbi:MAG: virulence protein RhuM/Fic/DOC family protein [Thermodesulfobacteriota bacterium]
MNPDLGEIILYQSEDGTNALDVHLKDETVWLSRQQMAELFGRDYKTVSKHINNVFNDGELRKKSVVANFATTGSDGKIYQVEYYNLDVVISVGYRVKSQRGTQFRIWATQVLRDHLVRGYTLNQHRLAEKGVAELKQAMALLAATLEGHELVSEEGRAVLEIVNRYARTWRLLLEYDEEQLPVPVARCEVKTGLMLDETRWAIVTLKRELAARGEATDLFGQERGHGLAGILGAIGQTFGGQDLYPSIEEKAAHLLYFVIKDHPFSDGNKRIGSFLFVLYLRQNGLVGFDNRSLVALALLTAASEPGHKDLLVRLIVNLIGDEKEA